MSNTIVTMLAEAKQEPARIGELLEQYRCRVWLEANLRMGAQLRRQYSPDDLVQETLAKAFSKFTDFRGSSEGELTSWIMTILRSETSALVRRMNADKRPDAHFVPLSPVVDGEASCSWFEPVGDITTPSRKAINNEQASALAEALYQLPADQRHAVLLRHFEGKSIAEITQEMERSVTAVAGLLKRGLRGLKKYMDFCRSSSDLLK